MYSDESPKVEVSSNNLAYVIYTSGTTGEPKGVQNEHGGLYNRILWMQSDLNVNSTDVILQKTPFTFDVSVWEFILPMISGSQLVVAQPEGHKDPIYLSEAIKKNSVTILHFVPSMLDVFLSEANLSVCTSIKHVVSSGEALSRVVVSRFQDKLPESRLHNLYGPTEAAIDVTSIELTDDTSKGSVSIGRPVANTEIFILNESQKLQARGAIGEICIGGVQVARGYINKENLTNEKFIKNPFGEGRLYKTGDLGIWNPDGTIAYLGRLDDQVKIRGHRIELGEIEAVLNECKQVENTVLTTSGNGKNKLLQAYVVLKESGKTHFSPSVGEDPVYEDSELETIKSLKAYLKERLPFYMIPNNFYLIKEVPLTPNGKFDKNSLPDFDGISSKVEYVPPGDEMEEKLVEIWEEILGKKQIGILDDFFELGGHSLKAVQLISRISKMFNVKINFMELFSNATIKGVKEEIEKIYWANSELSSIENNIDTENFSL